MMRTAQYLLIVAGVVGIIGLFTPMLTLKKGPFEQALSARDLAVEGHYTNGIWQRKVPKIALDRLSNALPGALPATIASVKSDVEDALLATRLMTLVFAPSMVLLLIGLVSMFRGRLGAWIAFIALLISVISVTSTFALRWGVETYSIEHLTIRLEPGAYIPVLIGAIGIAAVVARHLSSQANAKNK
jgi:hypothetical protein